MAPNYRIAIMNEDIGKFGYDSMQQRTKKTRNMEKNSSQCANWGSGRKSEGGGYKFRSAICITECKLSHALSCRGRWTDFVVMSHE